MSKNCDICTILQSNNDDVVITKTKFWRVALERNQAYLGQSFVTLLEHKSSLSEVTDEEWHNFQDLVKQLEAAYKKAFGATHFNWTCLMNEAYRQDSPAPHVHWHVFPRYKAAPRLDDMVFEDTEFGHHYVDRKNKVDQQTLETIGHTLKVSL